MLGKFVKRNAPVFILGFIILLVFLAIIVGSQKQKTGKPSGFIKVEESLIKDREPTEPETTTDSNGTVTYAPQIASPENIGKPYFYGETNPTLRDEQGYPTPPKLGSTPISPNDYPDVINARKQAEQDAYAQRTKTITIDFTKDGFSPADSNAYTGQKVMWTNKSTGDIELRQVIPIHEALKNTIYLAPGQSFEFRALVNGRATIIEARSGKYSTIYVSDVTVPLL